MRRKDREITEPAEIEAIIQEAKVCRLAMVDDGQPYVVPLNFGYRDNTLFFHSASSGRKIDVLKKNGRVCFEMDLVDEIKAAEEACDWGIRYRSVIGFGNATLLDDPDEKCEALDTIMGQHSNETFTYPASKLKATAVIRVDIERMTGKRA